MSVMRVCVVCNMCLSIVCVGVICVGVMCVYVNSAELLDSPIQLKILPTL